MSDTLIFVDTPKTIRRSRESITKYEFLMKTFGAKNNKPIFKLAMKIGYYMNLLKKLDDPVDMYNTAELQENEKITMLAISFSNLKSECNILTDKESLLDGKKIIKVCEEYANGGVSYLYDKFSTAKKDKTRIIEDILDELKEKILTQD